MATAAKTVYPHISKDPEVCSGRACVEGTRVRVMDIVSLRRQGMSPEQMVEEFTSLSGVEDVYAALLYYRDHLDEVEADFAEDARLSQEWERNQGAPQGR